MQGRSEALEQAYGALERRSWEDSFTAFAAMDRARDLDADDLVAFSDAAFWAGHPVVAIEAAEQAFGRYLADGRAADAAAAGLSACRLHYMHWSPAVSVGWFEKVQRLLEDLPECAAHGHAKWIEGVFAVGLNDTDGALACAREVEQIGRRVGDGDLATHLLGDESPRRASATFVFTDLVDSTALLSAIGDTAWHTFRQWHDRTLRTIVTDHRGRVVKDTGDGLFAVFDQGADALAAVIALQRALADHREATGFAPAVRIGLHEGTAIMVEDDYTGRDVVIAARIGARAGAGEILASRGLVDELPGDASALPRGLLALKGIPDPVDVVEIRWR